MRFRRTKYTNAQQPELLMVNPQAARRDRSALRLCGFTYASFQVTLPILFLHTRIVLLFDTRVLTLTYAGLLPLSRSSPCILASSAFQQRRQHARQNCNNLRWKRQRRPSRLATLPNFRMYVTARLAHLSVSCFHNIVTTNGYSAHLGEAPTTVMP